jgi:hypothetical protein
MNIKRIDANTKIQIHKRHVVCVTFECVNRSRQHRIERVQMLNVHGVIRRPNKEIEPNGILQRTLENRD